MNRKTINQDKRRACQTAHRFMTPLCRTAMTLLFTLLTATTVWAQTSYIEVVATTNGTDSHSNESDKGTAAVTTGGTALAREVDQCGASKITLHVKPLANYSISLNDISIYISSDGTNYSKQDPEEAVSYSSSPVTPDDSGSPSSERDIILYSTAAPDRTKIYVDFKPIPLTLLSNLGDNATVTFYDGGTIAPTTVNTSSLGSPITSISAGHYVMMHIVPADGYLTNADLLYGMELVEAPFGVVAGTRSGSDGESDHHSVTMIQADSERHDGAGWYYYQIPAANSIVNNYNFSSINGDVMTKFDLSTATPSSDGKTYTVSNGDWNAIIETDGKTSFAYDGSAHAPQITSTSIKVMSGSTEVASFAPVNEQVTMVLGGTNLSESGEAINVGSYTATLTAVTTTSAGATAGPVSTGIFINSKDIPFSITKKDMNTNPTGSQSKMTVKVNPTSFIYNGTKQVPEVKVYDGEGDNAKEIPATEYDVSYKYKSDGTAVTDPTKAAEYTIVISDKAGKTNGNYNIVGGTAEFEITAKEVGLSWDKTSFTYDTEAHQPVATVTGLVTVNGKTDACKVSTYKVEAKDGSSLTDGKAVNVGNYKVTATALDNANYKLPSAASTDFSINQEGTFTISFDASIAEEYYTYDGTAKEPAVVVKDGDVTLKKDLDYEVVYENNINAGENTASVKVTAKGNFKGSKTAKFSIKKATLKIKADAKEKNEGADDPELTYTSEGLVEGDAISGALTRDPGETVGTYAITQGTLSAGTNYTVTYKGANLTITAAKPVTPEETTYQVVVAKATGGNVVTSVTEAKKGQQVNMIVTPAKGYYLSSLSVVPAAGGSIQPGVTFDKDKNMFNFFIMPASDVTIYATFDAQEKDQNIFIFKSEYGEIVANVLHAEPGEQVNLETRIKDGIDNVVLDELYVYNEKGERLPISTIEDPKEGLVYYFFMKGDKAYVYNTFKGTNGTVDESKPVPPDNYLYLLSDAFNNFINAGNGVNGVQMAMSLLANILATFTPEGELSVNMGDDVSMALLNLKSGWQIKIDFNGAPIKVLYPSLLEGLGEDGTISSGVFYKMLSDGNLELLLKTGMLPLLIQSITIIAPEPDPTAINGLKADGKAADLYDLRGRKVDATNLRKGIYISDGRKVVIK